MLAQLESVIKVVDQASVATDRWLFLAAIVLILVGGFLAIRWLITNQTIKDATHEAAAVAARTAHAAERAEWRTTLATAKTDFVLALKEIQDSFRQELSTERHECAQERILDRNARHAMANALNGISLVLAEHRETLLPMNPEGVVGRPKTISSQIETKIT